MVSNKDIYASAKLLVEQHGEGAEGIALERMNSLMRQNDAKGASVWLGVMQAIADLNMQKAQGKPH